jgi:hypothetical protein
MNDENQLSIIVSESGLEPTKAKVLLDNFQDYFNIADEWTKKAKMIIVTKEDQKSDMAMARIGRLELREKRIAIEKTRKELKEQSLREGKAIDGIANVLKALIVPIEEYLDNQEHFVELKAKREAEQLRIEAEQKEEAERIAKEKAEKEELERLRIETVEKEKALQAERAEHERKAREEKAKADAILAEQKKKADAERAEHDKILAIERESAKKKQDAINAKLKAEKEEKEKLEEMLKNQIECPHCHKKFNLEKGV